MSSPDHELRLDLTEVNQSDRIKVIKLADKVGSTVLNDDLAPLIDNAPPEPKRKLTRALETELSTRAPFSFLVRPNKTGIYAHGRYEAGFRLALVERVKHLGITEKGVSIGLVALTDRNGSPTSVWSNKEALEEMHLSRYVGKGYDALTLHDPSQVTAARLREYGRGICLGEIGASAALAILVEVSRTVTHPTGAELR